jgi:flagellar protein FlgJ
MGNLAMAFNSLRQNPDENIPRIITGQRATREQDAANNRTVEWLSSQPGGERFAGLVESVGAAGALQAYQQSQAQPDQTSAMQNYQFLLAQGVPPSEAIERSFGDGGVTVNTGDPSTPFERATAAQLADETSDVVIAGATAQRSLGQIDVLEEQLLNSPSGAEAAFVSFAGDLGIALEGADAVQAANAIISQLVPSQRPPGSGQMSDADLALFKRSLPRLINTPGGNQRIISTMRAIGEYDMARGQIARQLQLGQLDFTAAAAAYDALGNPLELYRTTRGQAETDGATPPPDGGYTPAELEYLGVTNG